MADLKTLRSMILAKVPIEKIAKEARAAFLAGATLDEIAETVNKAKNDRKKA